MSTTRVLELLEKICPTCSNPLTQCTCNTLISPKDGYIIMGFTVINNTDQHLFLTEEHFTRGAKWLTESDIIADPTISVSPIEKPVIIEKMGGTRKFVIIGRTIVKSEWFQLIWSGGCDLQKFGFLIRGYNINNFAFVIDEKRYTATSKVAPVLMVKKENNTRHITITFDMNKKKVST